MEAANPYDYPPGNYDFNLRLLETRPEWRRYDVEFPSARPTNCFHNLSHGEYLRPVLRETDTMAVLVHGWGDRSLIPCRLLATALARRGIATFVPHLAFHSSRIPEPMREKRLNLTPDEWWQCYRTSVVEVRQIVDWAANDQGIRRQAVIGISLGGIIAAITMGVDTNIDAGVFLVTGGNFAHPDWQRGRLDEATKAEYAHSRRVYTDYLAQVAARGLENVAPPQQSYLTDPLTFAHNLRQRPVMMLNALWDIWVPRQAALDLWEGCDRPPIRWFPATHVSIWLFYPFIRRQIINFIMSTAPK